MGGYQTASADSKLPTAADFVAYVNNLYCLAQKYGGKQSPAELVTQFLRCRDYNDGQWEVLIGKVDDCFVRHVKQSGLPAINYFCDPCHQLPFKVAHFGAACNGVLIKGKPDGTATDAGDIAGWGGDLISFYAEWQRDIAKQPSGYKYCMERLAKKDVQSTFMLDDLIADADAFNVALKVREGSCITDEVKRHVFLGMVPGCENRFEEFREKRFGGQACVEEIARNMLLPSGNVFITRIRDYLIHEIAGSAATRPENLPQCRLDEFCKGFADVLNGLAAAS
jgi:hypothetical protein